MNNSGRAENNEYKIIRKPLKADDVLKGLNNLNSLNNDRFKSLMPAYDRYKHKITRKSNTFHPSLK